MVKSGLNSSLARQCRLIEQSLLAINSAASVSQYTNWLLLIKNPRCVGTDEIISFELVNKGLMTGTYYSSGAGRPSVGTRRPCAMSGT